MGVLFLCLTLSLLLKPIQADDVNQLVSQAESSAAKETSDASRTIEDVRGKAAEQTGDSVKLIDGLRSNARSEEITASSPNTKSSSSSKHINSARRFPKQGTSKRALLFHEGKGQCKDKGKGNATTPQGKCASSLLQGLEEKNLTNSSTRTQLLVFVSQSMPASSIKDLWQQAHQIGGKLLFRGLVGGTFKETQAYIQDLGIVADIDPTKFDEYGVKDVPTFILVQGERHDRMVGNVSIGEFLEQATQSGDLSGTAQELNKKIQGVRS